MDDRARAFRDLVALGEHFVLGQTLLERQHDFAEFENVSRMEERLVLGRQKPHRR